MDVENIFLFLLLNIEIMTYYIWFDESDKEGEYYSNFYGGILIRSKDVENVLYMMRVFTEEYEMNEEIKWQKVNAFNLEKYKKVVDFIFDLLMNDLIKIRIFFHNNQYIATGLTREHRRKEYSMLYYQFIKHAFGLKYSNKTNSPIFLRIMLDDMPLKGEDKDEFIKYIHNLTFDDGFKAANIHIRKRDISEVNSKEHLPLQMMDLILGSICFRLNNKHKVIDPQTGRRGNRTIAKEKLYKYINRKLRELKPGFNIGESTGIGSVEDRWDYPYMHWSFKPSASVRDFTKSKKKKDSSFKPTL